MGNTGGKSGIVQPIWKASAGRRMAAIVSLVGMVIVTLAAFLPAYGKIGNAVTDAAVSAVNALGSVFGVNLGLSTSFTLFEACQTNIVLMILLETAIALGFIFPILTETELEMIPAVLMAGIHIYVCVNAGSIYMTLYSSGLSGIGDAGDISSGVSLVTPGFLLSLAGLAVLIVGIVLHFLKGKDSRQVGAAKKERFRKSAANPAVGDPAYEDTDITSGVDKTQAVNTGSIWTSGNVGSSRRGEDAFDEDVTMPVVGSSGVPYGKAEYSAGVNINSASAADDITYPIGQGTYGNSVGTDVGYAAAGVGAYSSAGINSYRGGNMYQTENNSYAYQTGDMKDLYSGDPDAETNILDEGMEQGGPGRGRIYPVHGGRTEASPIPRCQQPVASLKRLNTGEVLMICEGDSVIGRSLTRAQLIVNSAAVSGAHARLSAYRGGCGVTDIGSTNGTYINGERISPNIRFDLKDGDYLSLGAEILEFHLM